MPAAFASPPPGFFSDFLSDFFAMERNSIAKEPIFAEIGLRDTVVSYFKLMQKDLIQRHDRPDIEFVS